LPLGMIAPDGLAKTTMQRRKAVVPMMIHAAMIAPNALHRMALKHRFKNEHCVLLKLGIPAPHWRMGKASTVHAAIRKPKPGAFTEDFLLRDARCKRLGKLRTVRIILAALDFGEFRRNLP
jgi:hypothetical protein